MVPGKKYAPEDYLSIAWRRKWLLIVPLVLAALGTFLYSRTLPNLYRSEATVLIIPQQVPENMARPLVDDAVARRLDLMRQQILSRARLERIIEEFNLYSRQRKEWLMDRVVEQMRDDIDLAVQKVGRRQDPNHFVVSYNSVDPQTAMQVAERLASLFLRENIEGRTIQSEQATQFMQSQADESLRQLQAHEGRFEAFRRANAGRLPTEVETNIQLMSNARQQIQTIGEGINRDREQQISIERMLSDEMTLVSASPVTAAKDSVQSAAQQLAAAKVALDGLLLRLKEDHPDVRIVRGRIRDLEKKAEVESLQQPLSDGTPVAVLSTAEVARQKRISQLRGEQQRLDREIETKQVALRNAQATLADQERRVQAAPALQSEMSDMMRGYDNLKATHEDNLKKLQAAKLSSSLEQRQVSQQFRIVDQARRPERPYSPDRVRMNLIGALAGLGLGLVIVGLLEYRDTSLRTAEDVLAALSLPVLALVPTMRTSQAGAPRRWRRFLLFGSGPAVMVVGAAVALVWKLRLLEFWGR